ncbi:helix-turn-helix transcriptional regulator [Mycobacterium sp. DSM 3803]|nr:helix-turn-helix transcriptional regulator [Mycobacterium sp. DSM 3803]
MRLTLGSADSGIDLRFISHTFAGPADWSIFGPEHEVRVWRRGTARHKEVVFDRGPNGYVTPRASDVWVIPAGSKSAALARDAACEFVRLTLSPALIGAPTLRPVVGRRDPLLHHMIERIAGTAGRTDAVSRLLRESLTDALRLHILDIYGERPTPVQQPGRAFDQAARQRLVDFLRDGLDREIDLPTLANVAGMPVAGFRRAFARTFNTTPYQYVLDQRIEKAKTLLSTTRMTMTEISVAAGFSSPSHFATTFKQRVGITPSAYRSEL